MNEKYELFQAEPCDSKNLKKIYDSISYDGLLDIQFLRGEDPYASIAGEGIDSVIVAAKNLESGETFGMGACCVHEMYVDGELKRAGYLNSLKIMPGYQRKTLLLPKAFAYMGKCLKGKTDLCFASVLLSAKEIQKMFEKKRKNMPHYAKQCVYTSFLFAPQRADKSVQLENISVSELMDFFEKRAAGFNLAPAGPVRGVCDENCYAWKKDGKTVAVCALVDETGHKNYHVRCYRGIAKIMPYVPTPLFGYPKFPKKGKDIDAVCISMLMFDENLSIKERCAFVKSASAKAKGRGLVMVGLTDSDPSYNAMKKIKTVKISSYLYTVNWGEDQMVNGRPIYADVTLM